MATTVNVQEAKTRLSELLREVESGGAVIIARAGRPIARLGPVEPRGPRFGGLVPDLIVPDVFFDELPAAELDAWESE
ncbi:type II toxin-antitoxin system Phd/YefM family antitoxin [Parenemella sanctibonifatiensis]|uniref:Antitoxin n=1 Tax=Parenemella sanctibonifatiensis TaxID=2016505 RepID=A0A255ECH7_9ACTN|nr:type II toxin-antitoxin system prevent-host-death family antitoxin [Parenemella sanctibonifatiensis]OYN89264.1 type II toxin-antitoxin system prevent-host-death family antitoxin [Parenemella sanctibonifatiensis]